MDDLVCVRLQRRVDRSAAMEMLQEFTTVTLTGKGWLCFARRELPRLDAADLPYREASPAEAEEGAAPLPGPLLPGPATALRRAGAPLSSQGAGSRPGVCGSLRAGAPALETLSPEAWVGRHGSGICVFSYHLYRFADPAVDAWVRRAGEILTNPALRKECLERFPDR